MVGRGVPCHLVFMGDTCNIKEGGRKKRRKRREERKKKEAYGGNYKFKHYSAIANKLESSPKPINLGNCKSFTRCNKGSR
jgi:hypothetical protein